MRQFKEHFLRILEKGVTRPDRDGNLTSPKSTLAVFGAQLRFDLTEGFPLTTSKELKLDAMAKEISWMLRGETNTKTLGCGIWDKWAIQQQLAIVTPVTDGSLIGQLAKLRGVKEEDLKGEHYTMYAAEIFEIQRKYVTVPEGIEVTRDGNTVQLTRELFQVEDMVIDGIEIDFEGLDAELTGMGLRMRDTHVQYEVGACGPIYGEQWRGFKSIIKQNGNFQATSVDQLMAVYAQLRDDLYSRRIMFSGFNPALVPEKGLTVGENVAIGKQSLPPCHVLCQFVVNPNPETGIPVINTLLTMRSSDGALGLGFNVGAYAAITHLFAAEFHLNVGELVVSIGDAHVYKGHIAGIKEYIDAPVHPLPKFKLGGEQYEAFKLSVVDQAIIAYVDTATYDTPEARQEALDKERAKVRLDKPENRIAVFKFFLDNIPHTFITDFVQGYECESHIPFDLYD